MRVFRIFSLVLLVVIVFSIYPFSLAVRGYKGRKKDKSSEFLTRKYKKPTFKQRLKEKENEFGDTFTKDQLKAIVKEDIAKEKKEARERLKKKPTEFLDYLKRKKELFFDKKSGLEEKKKKASEEFAKAFFWSRTSEKKVDGDTETEKLLKSAITGFVPRKMTTKEREDFYRNRANDLAKKNIELESELKSKQKELDKFNKRTKEIESDETLPDFAKKQLLEKNLENIEETSKEISRITKERDKTVDSIGHYIDRATEVSRMEELVGKEMEFTEKDYSRAGITRSDLIKFYSGDEDAIEKVLDAEDNMRKSRMDQESKKTIGLTGVKEKKESLKIPEFLPEELKDEPPFIEKFVEPVGFSPLAKQLTEGRNSLRKAPFEGKNKVKDAQGLKKKAFLREIEKGKKLKPVKVKTRTRFLSDAERMTKDLQQSEAFRKALIDQEEEKKEESEFNWD